MSEPWVKCRIDGRRVEMAVKAFTRKTARVPDEIGYFNDGQWQHHVKAPNSLRRAVAKAVSEWCADSANAAMILRNEREEKRREIAVEEREIRLKEKEIAMLGGGIDKLNAAQAKLDAEIEVQTAAPPRM